MPNKIGEAVLILKANAKGLKSGLDKASKATGGAVKGMQAKWQGFANKIPGVGGALAALATPAGAASAAIGLAAGAVFKMVTKTLDLGRSLGEAREALGVSAEKIQIWRRAIEETNGNAESFDAVVLRLRDSIGSAQTGNKAAQEGFEALGLSWEELSDKSPEDALKDVLTAANDTLEPTEAAAVKADLLGRSYTGMGGLASDSGADIDALLEKVADSAVVMSGDAVTSVDEYDEAMREMRDTMGKVAIAVGTKLIPKITSLITAIMDIGTELWPVINIMITPLKNAFDIITGAIDVAAKLLKGDFGGAWDAVLDTALSVMGNLVEVYNNTIAKIPGVAEIDMDVVRGALEGVRAKADDDLNPALEDTKEAMDDAAVSAGGLTTATDEMGEAQVTAADRIQASRKNIEDYKQAQDAAERGISDGMIPTLDEMHDAMGEAKEATEDLETATKDLGDTAGRVSSGAAADFDLWAIASRESLGEIQEDAAATALAATVAAEEIAAAAKKAADDTKAETDRINNSWDRFIVNQDEVVAAMNANSISFDQVMVELADSFGISTIDMALKAQEMGVTYNDTMALMEAFGRSKINGIIGDLVRLQSQAEAARAATVAAAEAFRQGRADQTFAEGYHAEYAEAGRQFEDLSPEARQAVIRDAGNSDPIAYFAKLIGLPLRNKPPALAAGGITTRDMLAQVHKNEAVIPLAKLPDMMSRMMGSGSGGRPPIIINGDVYGHDDFVDKVGQAGVELEERGG